ncbi:MAG: hypothetical protein FWD33_00110 [Alphaproteobacteria bacterium]|nr:hypothetical protein [Alphaproteobacteria bacterium]
MKSAMTTAVALDMVRSMVKNPTGPRRVFTEETKARIIIALTVLCSDETQKKFFEISGDIIKNLPAVNGIKLDIKNKFEALKNNNYPRIRQLSTEYDILMMDPNACFMEVNGVMLGMEGMFNRSGWIIDALRDLEGLSDDDIALAKSQKLFSAMTLTAFREFKGIHNES